MTKRLMPDHPYSDQHCFPHGLDLKRVCENPVIVESIEIRVFEGVHFVRARSTEGIYGTAMCNARAGYLVPVLRNLVIPAFLGHDARNLESLIDQVYVYRNNYKYHGTPFWNCVAYVEAGLLDLLGVVAEKPVHKLIGGAYRSHIPVYLSSMHRDTQPEEEVAWLADRLAATGATAVKHKIGGRMRNDEDSLPRRTERLIPLARRRFGDEVTLYADANGSYSASKATQVGAALHDYGYGFFEEPCPFENYEATRAVTAACDIPVAGGEQDCNLDLFRAMIERNIVDIVQPDLMYNGGIVRALRVAKMAAEAGMHVTPHSPTHTPALATLLHFAAVTRNTGPFLEYPAKTVEFADWYEPTFHIDEGGSIAVPQGAGLGVTYDEDIWERATVVA